MKSEILAIFQIRKNTKNPEISEIANSRLSHFPTFLLSASFSPDQAAAAQILGRRPDSRLGRRGEKLGDCGIVGLWDCGEIAISEVSGFFMFFLI